MANNLAQVAPTSDSWQSNRRLRFFSSGIGKHDRLIPPFSLFWCVLFSALEHYRHRFLSSLLAGRERLTKIEFCFRFASPERQENHNGAFQLRSASLNAFMSVFMPSNAEWPQVTSGFWLSMSSAQRQVIRLAACLNVMSDLRLSDCKPCFPERRPQNHFLCPDSK